MSYRVAVARRILPPALNFWAVSMLATVEFADLLYLTPGDIWILLQVCHVVKLYGYYGEYVDYSGVCIFGASYKQSYLR